MGKQSISVLTLTATASGAVGADRFVTPAGAQAGAGVNTLGVSRTNAASGEKMPVDVMGTTILEAGAAVAAGAAIESDASGRAITRTAGVTAARALEAATAAGQFIEVLLIPN